ncbi:MAG: helicase-related protein [Anaerolineaceae bacterium]|nr:helicase-related protein [Anaerolineaceae bacterium]
MQPDALLPDVRVRNLIPGQVVTITHVDSTNEEYLTVGFRNDCGQTSEKIVFLPDGLSSIEIVHERMLHFDVDGELFRLIAEAWRLRNAHLFDPYSALHSARIRPLPHQVAAVYGEMLPRLPLRFLLADDPGAGKTIMTGLYIRELMARSALSRCLVCVPPGLALQWQQELHEKFDLKFAFPERLDAVQNPFFNNRLIIVSMDTLKQERHVKRLQGTEVTWDLIVCDEAHKMAAHFSGDEITRTDRYRLGESLGSLTRNLLLLTATPHNGKQEEYELFLNLLDPDRFRSRPVSLVGVGKNNAHGAKGRTDYMRRMVKEDLRDFSGKPLFPERHAKTLGYELPVAEEELYRDVTNYVREEYNRAERLESGKRHSVGFALTILQRRLASSPLAIFRSLSRRRERLEALLRQPVGSYSLNLREEDFDAEELESESDAHRSVGATAAINREELTQEIASLHKLEQEADRLCRHGVDRKWDELKVLLQDPRMRQEGRRGRHKLVIFSEYRDTQEYLAKRLRDLQGLKREVVEIHGGVGQLERQRIQKQFNRESGPSILVATDAAAEGINLQSAHLMINYDLPWNPNRLEQRFGRIHRINQQEVCHLWNLVATNTREGAVFQLLEEKIRVIGKSLTLFDVLGEDLPGVPLRKLMVDALRYNESPEVRARLQKSADNYVEEYRRERELLQGALAHDVMDLSEINEVNDKVSRQEPSRLHPWFVRGYLLQALRHHKVRVKGLGKGRFEIIRVPYKLRRLAPQYQELAERYRRVCFEPSRIEIANEPDAELLHAAHPLAHAVTNLMLEDSSSLRRGALLVDETGSFDKPAAIFTVKISIFNGNGEEVEGEACFISIGQDGEANQVGVPPWLEFRPASDVERARVDRMLHEDWLMQEDTAGTAQRFATSYLARDLLARSSDRQKRLIGKEREEVSSTLKQAIQHEEKNVSTERQNEENERDEDRRNLARGRRLQAERRRDEEQQKLSDRLRDLEMREHLSVQPPVVHSAVLVLPKHMVSDSDTAPRLRDCRRLAIGSVLQAERALGNKPTDIVERRHPFDIENRDAAGNLRFIKVRSYPEGASHIMLTQNELVAALNSPERFILALVKVRDGHATDPRYLRGTEFPKQIMDQVNVSVELSSLLPKCIGPEEIS